MKRLGLFIAVLFCAPIAFAEPGEPITTGKFYAYGHELKTPYTLEIVENTVQVNGVQVFPRLEEVETPTKVKDMTRPEPYRSVFALQRRLRADGKPANEITAQMADHMRGQVGVDSVSVINNVAFWVYWDDGSNEQFTTYAVRRPDMNERCQTELEKLSELLEKNTIIVVASTGERYCPNRKDMVGRLMDEIEQARNATAEALVPGVWKGVMIDAGIARQFNRPLQLGE